MNFKSKSNSRSHPECIKYVTPFLLLYSINVTSRIKSRKSLFFFYRIICCLTWLFLVMSSFWCALKHLSLGFLFLLSLDLMSFFIWCLMCANSGNCNRAIHLIKRIRMPSKVLRISAIVCMSIISAVVVTLTVLSLRSSLLTGGKGLCSDIWMFIPNETVKLIIVTVPRLLMHLYSHGLFFTTSAFFFFTCMELNHAICCIIDDIALRRWNDCKRNMLYSVTVKALIEIENSMNRIVFFLLAMSFTIIFRVVISIIVDPLYLANINRSSISLPYMTGSMVVFVAVCLVADKLQNNFLMLRRSILNCCDFSDENCSFSGMARDFLTLMEDREYMYLTAWKTFYVQRSLLLTAVASLITYSVLLTQYRL